MLPRVFNGFLGSIDRNVGRYASQRLARFRNYKSFGMLSGMPKRRWGSAVLLAGSLAVLAVPNVRTSERVVCLGAGGEGKMVCLSQSSVLGSTVSRLLGKVRNQDSDCHSFAFNCDRLMNILIDVALGMLSLEMVDVITPTGAPAKHLEFDKPVTAISILRSGDAIMKAFVKAMPTAPTGQLLLSKHEEDAAGSILYSRLPKNLDRYQLLLLDPMIATGRTMVQALRIFVDDYKVDPKSIVVVSLISCPEGIKKVHSAFPDVTILTASVDDGLDANSFITPGIGCFGDRYFRTKLK